MFIPTLQCRWELIMMTGSSEEIISWCSSLLRQVVSPRQSEKVPCWTCDDDGVFSSVHSGQLVCSFCDPAENLLNTELQQMCVSVFPDPNIYMKIPGRTEGGHAMLSAVPSANYACGSKNYVSRFCSCLTIHIAPQVTNWVWRIETQRWRYKVQWK